MHIYNLDRWKHSHDFERDNRDGERSTRQVIVLTVVMMVVEIGAGIKFGSMALLADGWHMGTHAVALGITAFAYYYARRHADNPRFSFGTGKVGVLGGYTSAVALAMVSLLMVVESVQRLLAPEQIHFNEAIGVAVVGLGVNLLSAYLLRDHHHHHDHGDHRHGHDGDDHGHTIHHDHNLRAAYMHVIADALTSVLAIVALLAGKIWGWNWMDPCMGIVGAAVILRWAYGLLLDTGTILLDRGLPRKTLKAMRAVIEAESDNRVTDLHVWPVGSHHYAAIVSIATHYPQSPDNYKKLLHGFSELEHITVEIIPCRGESCLRPI